MAKRPAGSLGEGDSPVQKRPAASTQITKSQESDDLPLDSLINDINISSSEIKALQGKWKGMSLENKMLEFRKIMLRQAGCDEESPVDLRKFFSNDEMSGFWQKLKGKLKKASVDTRTKYQQICDLPARAGKREKKATVLTQMLVHPDTWEANCRTVFKSLSVKQTRSEEKEWLTRGQIEVQYGKGWTP